MKSSLRSLAAAALCAVVPVTNTFAIDFVINDDANVDPAIDRGSAVVVVGQDTLTIDYDEFAPPSRFRLFRAIGEVEMNFLNGTFNNTNIFAFGRSSVRIYGGEFLGGNNMLRLREFDGPPEEEENGLIQLFVQEIHEIVDLGGADLGGFFPGFTENFTINLPPGGGPESQIIMSGIWSNGDHFENLRIMPQGGDGSSINVWQSQALLESEDQTIDTAIEGIVEVELLNTGEEGAVSAVFNPLDTGSEATFVAEYVNGHSTQLQGVLDERSIPTILPETAENEGFDIWFLDYTGEVEEGDITLELSFNPDEYTDQSSLVVYHFDEEAGEWEELVPTSIDAENGILTIVTDNLSPFLLGEAGATVPEPSSMMLLGLGLLGLAGRSRRQR
jgi:hypothetical protein